MVVESISSQGDLFVCSFVRTCSESLLAFNDKIVHVSGQSLVGLLLLIQIEYWIGYTGQIVRFILKYCLFHFERS